MTDPQPEATITLSNEPSASIASGSNTPPLLVVSPHPTKRESVISDAARSQIAETSRRELRIEFAKAALTGLLAAGDAHAFNRAEMAAEAWRQADATLATEVQVTTPTPPPPPPGTTHSPGPWRICGPSKTSVYTTIKAADGRTVARIGLRNPQNAPRTDRTDTNNALAISLLPEMLVALEDMVRLVLELKTALRGMPGAPYLDLGGILRLEQAEKLITKARGQ